jgi:hypothetical protein
MAQAHYTFSHSLTDPDLLCSEYPTDKQVEHRVTFDDSVRWPVIVDEFFCFLGSIYGYPISAKKYYEAKKGG